MNIALYKISWRIVYLLSSGSLDGSSSPSELQGRTETNLPIEAIILIHVAKKDFYEL